MDKVKLMVIINLALTALIGVALVGAIILTSGNKTTEVEQPITPEIKFDEMTAITFEESLHNIIYSLDLSKAYNIRFKLTVSLETEHKDFDRVKGIIENADQRKILISEINDLVRTKSYEEIARTDSKTVLEQEILELLKEKIGTQSILRVSIWEYYHDK